MITSTTGSCPTIYIDAILSEAHKMANDQDYIKSLALEIRKYMSVTELGSKHGQSSYWALQSLPMMLYIQITARPAKKENKPMEPYILTEEDLNNRII